MILSRKTTYGIQALLELGSVYPEGQMPIRTIAGNLGMSRKFLDQVLLQLKNSGILKSTQGAAGGYSLNLPPEWIKVADIIESLSGKLPISHCLDDDHTCRTGEACPVRSLSEGLRSVVQTYLAGLTLKDVALLKAKGQMQYDI